MRFGHYSVLVVRGKEEKGVRLITFSGSGELQTGDSLKDLDMGTNSGAPFLASVHGVPPLFTVFSTSTPPFSEYEIKHPPRTVSSPLNLPDSSPTYT